MRRNREYRMEAFDRFIELKKEGSPRKTIVDKINSEFGIPAGTLYTWYNLSHCPYGRKGKIIICKELLYVLGALLGDGCLYKWKKTNNYVILTGEYEFASKFSKMLHCCTGTIAKPYLIRRKNVWIVKINNYELFELFRVARSDHNLINGLIGKFDTLSSLYLVEGFFDAEGCVKIINDECRKTPKICLDITNTNKRHLEIIKGILLNALKIKSYYSIQKSNPITNRKTSYHLRIYKKNSVRLFFDYITTIKLKSKKEKYLVDWLNL